MSKTKSRMLRVGALTVKDVWDHIDKIMAALADDDDEMAGIHDHALRAWFIKAVADVPIPKTAAARTQLLKDIKLMAKLVRGPSQGCEREAEVTKLKAHPRLRLVP